MVQLFDVDEVRETAEELVAALQVRISEWFPGLAVEHVGATALQSGRTKGDVDVAVRPTAEQFPHVVDVLRKHYQVAQQQNWRPTFASFSDTTTALPLGIQVSVRGSDDDFLVAIRDRMIHDEDLRAEYDRCKGAAATGSNEDYWGAKNEFLQRLLQTLSHNA